MRYEGAKGYDGVRVLIHDDAGKTVACTAPFRTWADAEQWEREQHMTEGEWRVLQGFAVMIEQTEREGAQVDQPEGVRRVRITLSDTFAERLTMALRQVATELEDVETLRATNREQAEGLELLRQKVNELTDPKIIVPRMGR